MTRRRRPSGALAYASLALIASGWTADAAAAESLQDAWREALAADRTLRAAQSRVESASAERDAAGGARLPALDLSAGITRWRDTPAFDFSAAGLPGELPLFEGRSMKSANARLSLPVYTGGRIGAAIDAADASLAARRTATDSTRQDVKLATAENYVAVLRAASALAIADARVRSLDAHTRDVDSMFRNGQVARNDLLAASVSLADARQQRLRAENALELARAAYNRGLGRPLEQAVSLEPQLPPIDPELLSSLTGTLALAAGRSELAALAATGEALAARSAAARADALPQVALAGGWTSLDNQVLDRDEFWTVGVTVEWRLLDGGASRNRSAALAAEARAVTAERENLRSLIELSVRRAWLEVEDSRERVKVAESAVEQAEENLRVVRDRYLQGEGTNTEVLDAETLLTTSRANYDSARFDNAVAGFRLARAAGTL